MQFRNILKLVFFFISMVSLLSLMGCWGGPVLTDVSVNPTAITPNADGVEDVTRISYHLDGSANLSIYFIDEAGQRYYFRDSRRRSQGNYQVDFGGVVEGSMLPDGRYTWVVEAVTDDNQTIKEEGSLAIGQADTEKPELQGFSVYPHVFSPNQDGINDRVDINYYLTKEAEVLVYLIA
ncbi:MAG: gliding motility-associated C-terminal domain-containing protein, partial [Anaerolineae bacterium]|nr:gliding motility-associated C-terminal domain-containing protein [Anaerolineae bacterium]